MRSTMASLLHTPGGFYVVHNPGVAETLDMRDASETLVLLKEQAFPPVAQVRF